MTRGVRSPLLVVCALFGAIATVQAQLAAALEAGASRVAFDGDEPSTALSLTPSLQWEQRQLTLLGIATYSSFPTGGWSLQGAASGSWLIAPRGSINAELAGFALGSTSESAGESAQFLARARLHALGERSGLWLGATGGWGGFEDARIGSAALEVAGWIQRGPSTIIGSLAPNFVGDDSRYLDAQLDTDLPLWRMLLQGQLGVRGWSRPETTPSRVWANLTAILPLNSHMALVGSGGSYAEDVVQQLPFGSYVSLSLRITTGRVPRPEPGLLVRPQRREPLFPPVAPEVSVRRVEDSLVVFRVRAPEAEQVEMMGDFTGWEPRVLERVQRDRWEIRLPVPAGPHHFNLRVNGGPWGVPAGVTTVEDEFGGVAGLLLVP